MKTNNKAFFVQRFTAYIIDMIIISIAANILTFPFTNTDTIVKLDEEVNTVMKEYTSQEINFETYYNRVMDINYEQARTTGFTNIITIIILVLYFIVFQIYNNGQTIGKKIMGIRIVKYDDSELTMNNMIIRELFNNLILLNILVCTFVLMGKDVYLYGSAIAETIFYGFIMITMGMISFRNDGRGLSDFIGKTKVIREKKLESEV